MFLTSLIPSYSQDVKSIPFVWSSDTLNGEVFNKIAMKIPVKFEDDSLTYYFQFDTGSNKSFLYTGGKVDSVFFNRLTNSNGVSSSLGTLNLLPRKSNSIRTVNGKITIGTIGSDFLSDKIIEIDFPNQKINFIESYDSALYVLNSLQISYGRPVLSVKISRKQYGFLLDTGSSLFELWTSKKLWKKWKDPNSKTSEFPISSWGKINTSYRADLKKPIAIYNCSNATMTQIWYNSNRNFERHFKQSEIDGIVGNKPFLHNVVLIDLSQKVIGIKKCT